MRLLLEFLVIAVLVFLGWRQPLRDQVRHTFPNLDLAPSRLTVVNLEAQYVRTEARGVSTPGTAPSPRDNRWMWQPGALDPKKKE